MSEFEGKINEFNEYQLSNLASAFKLMPDYYGVELHLIKKRQDLLAEEALERRKRMMERIKEEQEQKRLAKEKAEEAWLEDPENQATIRGWKALKAITPNLDGVDNFRDLPEALKYRYDAFRRAVEEKPQLPVVESHNQLYGKGSYTRIRSEHDSY